MSSKTIAYLLTRGLMTKRTKDDDGDKLIQAAHKMAEMVDHIEELRRALKPLAEMYAYTAPDGQLLPSITGGDIKQARTAMDRGQ